MSGYFVPQEIDPPYFFEPNEPEEETEEECVEEEKEREEIINDKK